MDYILTAVHFVADHGWVGNVVMDRQDWLGGSVVLHFMHILFISCVYVCMITFVELVDQTSSSRPCTSWRTTGADTLYILCMSCIIIYLERDTGWLHACLHIFSYFLELVGCTFSSWRTTGGHHEHWCMARHRFD